jgi:hypothetical protein
MEDVVTIPRMSHSLLSLVFPLRYHPIADGLIDWREIQTLTRSMPDFHKTLVLVNVKDDAIEELAMATEHAPFRHRPAPQAVGSQVKPLKKTKLLDNSE